MTLSDVQRALSDPLIADDIRHAASVAIEACMLAGGEQALAINVLVADLIATKRHHQQRTADALKLRRAVGRRAGTVPYGFRAGADGRTLVEDARESNIVNIIVADRAAGLSPCKTSDRLNAMGYVTRGGGRWHHQYVRSILRTIARNANNTNRHQHPIAT